MTFTDVPALKNAHVELHPLGHAHRDDLAESVEIGEIWRAWFTQIPSPETMAAEIAYRLQGHADGMIAPWAIVDPVTGKAVGMTSYLQPDPVNRRLEIGATWIGRSWQGTRVNAATKLLLLERAFDTLGCIAVEMRSHWHNHRSRAAIAKLGAKQDGVLRNHRILDNGTIRDTVVYSILDSEWNTVRCGLRARLTS